MINFAKLGIIAYDESIKLFDFKNYRLIINY
jgi:hypothetical protein